MGLCETSNFSIFTFSCAGDLKVCTHSYSNCLSLSWWGFKVRMETFAKWWRHTSVLYSPNVNKISSPITWTEMVYIVRKTHNNNNNNNKQQPSHLVCQKYMRKRKGAVKMCMTALKMHITCKQKCDKYLCELWFVECMYCNCCSVSKVEKISLAFKCLIVLRLSIKRHDQMHWVRSYAKLI